MTTLHYTSGGSNAEIRVAGFNLADVQSVEALNELPPGTKGLVYLKEGDGVTQSFLDKVRPYIGNPKLFGFFLLDEPDPTGKWGKYTTAEDLKAESDWIHANLPGAKTFISMMNTGSSKNPDFSNNFNPENTHIDYFGLSPYPVRSETTTVDYNMIDRTVAAAVKSGIPIENIVPILQTFGGGNWHNDSGGKYVMPTAAQMQQMLDHWDRLVPNPAFDYAYSWGTQEGDTALESSLSLQQVLLKHNLADSHVINGTAGNDVLTGTAGDDIMQGLAGNDTLSGGAGHDLLFGGAGDDKLVGGTGADYMVGGNGNDSYYVDNPGDIVNEKLTTGIDKVYASISFSLADTVHVMGNVEELILTGTGNLTGAGNALDNRLTGNSGNNILNGGAGRDVIMGRDGNDNLLGGDGPDILNGGAGRDVLTGGAGADRLTGGTGADTFVFQSTADSQASVGHYDTILDFSRAQGDKISLTAIDANTGTSGNQAFSFIGTHAFGHHAGELRYDVRGSDAFVYGDVNGDGRADFEVRLVNVTSLAASDFLL